MNEKRKQTGDAVNHPGYYCKGGIECHAAVAAAVSNLTGVDASDTAQAIQYLWRWGDKNDEEDLKMEDLRKARRFIDFILERHEADGEEKKNGGQFDAVQKLQWLVFDIVKGMTDLQTAIDDGEDVGRIRLTTASLGYRLENAGWEMKQLRKKMGGGKE